MTISEAYSQADLPILDALSAQSTCSFVGNLISLGTADHLQMCTRRGQGLDRMGFNLSNCLEGKQYTKCNDLQYVVVLSFQSYGKEG